MKIVILPAALSTLCLFFLSACGPQVAGFGSETTNGLTGGVIISLTGSENLRNAEIKIVPAGFNAATGNHAEIITAKTDSTGKAMLKIPKGKRYSIYASHAESGRKSLLQNIVVLGDTTLAAELLPTGELKVNFVNSESMLDTVKGYLAIDGYPEYLKLSGETVRTDSTISVTFTDLPQAVLEAVRYGALESSVDLQLLKDSVAIRSNNTTVISTTLFYRYMTRSNSPLLSDTVTAVTLGAEPGLVWIGTNQGITRFKNNTFQSRTTGDSPLRDNLITAVCESSDSITWFGTPNGLARISPTVWFNHTLDNSTLIPSNHITALASTRRADLWIGTDAGLVFVTRDSTYHFGVEQGLPSAHITTLAVDSEGILWGGTPCGAFRINQQREIKSYTQASLGVIALPQPEITDIEINKNGDIWICTAGGGIVTFVNGEMGILRFGGNYSILNHVTAIESDQKESIWLGTKSGALIKWDKSQWYCYFNDQYQMLPAAEMLSFAIDSNENLYIGTAGKGLFLLGPEAEELFLTE